MLFESVGADGLEVVFRKNAYRGKGRTLLQLGAFIDEPVGIFVDHDRFLLVVSLRNIWRYGIQGNTHISISVYREFDVFGGEGIAVVEFDVSADMERPDPFRAHVVAFSDIGNDVSGLIPGKQCVEHARCHDRITMDRIEGNVADLGHHYVQRTVRICSGRDRRVGSGGGPSYVTC